MRRILFSMIGCSVFLLCACTVEQPSPKVKTSHRVMPARLVDTTKVYKMADQMPLFRKCDPPTNEKKENRSCSATAIYDYIAEHQKHFRECGCSVAGTVVAQLIINRKGRVEHVYIKRSWGCEPLDAYIIQLFKNMPTWETTGMQNGIPVKIQYHVPVRTGY